MGKNRYYCRIHGIVHNLSDIQEYIDQGRFDGAITLALHENHGMDIIDALTFEDVIQYNNREIPIDYDEALKKFQAYNKSRIRNKAVSCPYCHSTNVEKFVRGGLCPYVRWRCEKCGRQFSV